MKPILKFAETFVGCGGSHIGLKNIGFEDVFVNDNNKTFLESFKLNNPSEKCKVFCEPIETLANRNILNITGLKKGEIDLLFGGVVCKGFSLAGVRNPNDPRNTLYLEQLNIVQKIMPKFSVIENVP